MTFDRMQNWVEEWATKQMDRNEWLKWREGLRLWMKVRPLSKKGEAKLVRQIKMKSDLKWEGH